MAVTQLNGGSPVEASSRRPVPSAPGARHSSIRKPLVGAPSSAFIVTSTMPPTRASPVHGPYQVDVSFDSVTHRQASSTAIGRWRVTSRSRPAWVLSRRPLMVMTQG